MPARLAVTVVGTVLSGALLAGAAGCGGDTPHYQGIVRATPLPFPSVPLTDTTGSPYDLAKHADGKATLLYFGYTNCPDVCPATMADVASALRLLPAPVRDQVRVVFVTSDPDRDTAPVIGRWLARFGLPAGTVGLRGTVAQVDQAGAQAGVPLFPPKKLPDGTVDVEHGADLIGYTAGGKGWVEWLTDQDHPQALTQTLRHDLPLLVRGRTS